MAWTIQLATSFTTDDTCQFLENGVVRHNMGVGTLMLSAQDSQTVLFRFRGNGQIFKSLLYTEIALPGPPTSATDAIALLMATGAFNAPAGAGGATLAGFQHTTETPPPPTLFGGVVPLIKPIPASESATYNAVTHSTVAGNPTITLRKNGVNVPGWENISVTTATATTAPTNPVALSPGDELDYIVVSLGAGPNTPYQLHLVLS